MTPCTTCAGTGYRAGARECFVPRPGKVFFQADFPQLELYTLAQCCKTWLGASRLADALNAGLDPHMQVAALILGCSYEEASRRKKEEVVKTARGSGKVANFGFPGGLGIDSLVSYAKKAYGQTLTRTQAKHLKEHWLTAWPEMQWYFQRVNGFCEAGGGKATVETLFTKRTRGRASYCAACNNGFQALGADCAKAAWWEITKACYGAFPYGPPVMPEQISPWAPSPMTGSRIVAMVHDEFIGECDDNPQAHDVAHELARLMVLGANKYLPDVPIPLSKMEPLLMRRWSKNAEPILGADGRLIPWAPKPRPTQTAPATQTALTNT